MSLFVLCLLSLGIVCQVTRAKAIDVIDNQLFLSINDGGREAVMQMAVLSPVLDNTEKRYIFIR